MLYKCIGPDEWFMKQMTIQSAEECWQSAEERNNIFQASKLSSVRWKVDYMMIRDENLESYLKLKTIQTWLLKLSKEMQAQLFALIN